MRVVDSFIARQPAIDRLREQSVQPGGHVLAPAVVTQRTRRKVRQPERVIQLAYHQQTSVRTELRAPELLPHTMVKIHPVTPLGTCARWMIYETRPS